MPDESARFADVRRSSARASRILKAMSNERRFLILTYLAEGEKSVGELELLIGISQSALSQHLARLRHSELVSTRRDAQNIYYSLRGGEAEAIIATLQDLVAEDRGGAVAFA
jgi:DNA-binding transcriptional ArsR family regulator